MAVASSGYNRRVRWYLAAAYALLLAYLSLSPGQRLPKILSWSDLFSPDKIAHFGAYAVLALLLCLALGRLSLVQRTFIAVLAAAGYGALMEFLQAVAGTGRDFDPVDMVANLLGAILGGGLYVLFLKFVIPHFAPAGS